MKDRKFRKKSSYWLFLMLFVSILLYLVYLLVVEVNKYFGYEWFDEPVKQSKSIVQNNFASTKPSDISIVYNSDKSDFDKSEKNNAEQLLRNNQSVDVTNQLAYRQLTKDQLIGDSKRSQKPTSTFLEVKKLEINPSITESSNRIEVGALWLNAQPKSSFSLQLASFNESSQMDVFIESASYIQKEDVHQLQSANGWYYLLYGSFETKEKALTMKTSLPNSDSVILRNIGEIRERRCLINANDSLDPEC